MKPLFSQQNITSLLVLLLSGNLAIALTSAPKEFAAGDVLQYSTAGHPKAAGINMVIRYPATWAATEGERPHIVQKFVSEGGRGLQLCMIGINPLPLAPGTVISERELKEFFTPAAMKDILPRGSNFLNAERTEIEGLPAGILEYSLQGSRAGITLDSQIVQYMFIYNTAMVQLQCMVSTGQISNPTPLNHQMESFKSLFILMANSIVLPDRWK